MQQPPTGPVLDKETLAWLSDAKPALADRILKLWDEEARHRREQEAQELRANIAATVRGQYIGLAIGALSIVGGTVAGVFGSGVAGATLGGAGVLGLVAASALSRTPTARRERSSAEKGNPDSSRR